MKRLTLAFLGALSSLALAKTEEHDTWQYAGEQSRDQVRIVLQAADLQIPFDEVVQQYPIQMDGWTLVIDEDAPYRRLGHCRWIPKEVGISRHHLVLGTAESILDTLYHELAHVMAGLEASHSLEWKAWYTVLRRRHKNEVPETVI